MSSNESNVSTVKISRANEGQTLVDFIKSRKIKSPYLISIEGKVVKSDMILERGDVIHIEEIPPEEYPVVIGTKFSMKINGKDVQGYLTIRNHKVVFEYGKLVQDYEEASMSSESISFDMGHFERCIQQLRGTN